MEKISRFVFNFRDKCNMNCPYCYVPFVDHQAGDIDLWKRIIDRIEQYRPDIITFGGGEPFAHDGFIELLRYCKQYSFSVHVDTNGIPITASIAAEMKDLIALTGIPFDGSEKLHDSLRCYRGHFKSVVTRMELLSTFGVPVRINSVLSPRHKTQLYDIAELLHQYSNIKQWFIYEYWHFKGINPRGILGDKQIIDEEVIETLRKISGIHHVHFSSVKERTPSYVFVSSLGNLYTIAENSMEYRELGSIFHPDSNAILSSLSNIQAINSRAKLKQTI